MTIDKAISDLTELKICGVVPFTKGTVSGGDYKVITENSLDMAIETMHKYEKIKQILDDCDLEAWEVLEKIRKVAENGSN